MDIMYTETDIRKDTSQQVFQRGKWLYQSGNVQHIQIQDVRRSKHMYREAAGDAITRKWW